MEAIGNRIADKQQEAIEELQQKMGQKVNPPEVIEGIGNGITQGQQMAM